LGRTMISIYPAPSRTGMLGAVIAERPGYHDPSVVSFSPWPRRAGRQANRRNAGIFSGSTAAVPGSSPPGIGDVTDEPARRGGNAGAFRLGLSQARRPSNLTTGRKTMTRISIRDVGAEPDTDANVEARDDDDFDRALKAARANLAAMEKLHRQTKPLEGDEPKKSEPEKAN